MQACSPYFVFPVRKGDGKFFTLICQFQDKHAIFTYLEDYKRDPARAEPYLAVTFFDDFMSRKGLVLVRGDFSYHLNKQDAARLLRLLHHFYVVDPRHVETFNKDPRSFDFTRFLAECP